MRQFGLTDVRLTLLQWVASAVYEVRAPSGERRVLRVHDPAATQAEIRSELAWLEHIAPRCSVRVPRTFRTSTGDTIAPVDVGGAPRTCSLLTWIPGRRMRKRVPVRAIREVGRVMAHLHDLAEDYAAPPGFERPRWDAHRLVRRNDTTSIGWSRLTASQTALFEYAADRFEEVARALGEGREAFGYLHGDMSLGNLLVEHGKIGLIDFADSGFGHFAYDLATLLDFLEARTDYRELRAAALEGYRERRSLSLSEQRLDLFLAARWVFIATALLGRDDHATFRAVAPRVVRIVERKLPALVGYTAALP